MSRRTFLVVALAALTIAPLAALAGRSSPGDGLDAIDAPAPVAAQTEASGDAGYADRHVFAGYAERPEEVTEVRGGRAARPTRYCVLWTVALAQITGTVQTMPLDEAVFLSTLSRGELIEGQEYAILCYRDGDAGPYLISFIIYRRNDPTQGSITTIETVEQYARSLITAPEPEIVTTPPADRLVVGFETWFSSPAGVAAAPRIAQAGPMWARADVLPTSITYDTGDGIRLVCPIDSSPATALPTPAPSDQSPAPAPTGTAPSRRPECARHTFLDSGHASGAGHFDAKASVTYDVWLTTSEEPTRRFVDTLDGPTTEVPLTVRSLQAVIR
jgi:hypothetical protein